MKRHELLSCKLQAVFRCLGLVKPQFVICKLFIVWCILPSLGYGQGMSMHGAAGPVIAIDCSNQPAK